MDKEDRFANLLFGQQFADQVKFFTVPVIFRNHHLNPVQSRQFRGGHRLFVGGTQRFFQNNVFPGPGGGRSHRVVLGNRYQDIDYL